MTYRVVPGEREHTHICLVCGQSFFCQNPNCCKRDYPLVCEDCEEEAALASLHPELELDDYELDTDTWDL